MSRFNEEDICKRYIDGMSSIKIGELYFVSDTTIRKILKRNNIKMRKGYDHCKTNNPMLGKTHSDNTKQKLRTLTNIQFSDPKARNLASHKQIEYMKNNPNKQQRSKLEFIVEKELDSLGINYKSPFPVQDPQTGKFRALADIYLVDFNAVIEVNGTYWHSDPRFYPDGPVTDSQKRVDIRYKDKQELYKTKNLRLIELWEHDIKADSSRIVRDSLTGIING